MPPEQFTTPNTFSGSIQPSPIALNPPRTPEELEQKRQGFLSVLSDPRVQAGLLQFTAQVLQPRAPGQSTVGAVAQSALSGAAAAGRANQAQLDQEDRERQRATEERRVAATERTATTGERRAGTDEERLLLDRERLERASSQQQEELAARLGIARESNEFSVLGILSRAEQERADQAALLGLGDPTFDAGKVLENFQGITGSLRGGAPAVGAPQPGAVEGQLDPQAQIKATIKAQAPTIDQIPDATFRNIIAKPGGRQLLVSIYGEVAVAGRSTAPTAATPRTSGGAIGSSPFDPSGGTP